MVDPRSLRSLRWHGSDELPVGGNVISNAARLKPGGVFKYLSRLARPISMGGHRIGSYFCAERRYFFATRPKRKNHWAGVFTEISIPE